MSTCNYSPREGAHQTTTMKYRPSKNDNDFQFPKSSRGRSAAGLPAVHDATAGKDGARGFNRISGNRLGRCLLAMLCLISTVCQAANVGCSEMYGNCKGCINCSEMTNCTGCTGCSELTKCTGCAGCSELTNCTGCAGCREMSNCHNCTKSNEVQGSNNIVKCSEIQGCSYLINCTEMQGCHYLIGKSDRYGEKGDPKTFFRRATEWSERTGTPLPWASTSTPTTKKTRSYGGSRSYTNGNGSYSTFDSVTILGGTTVNGSRVTGGMSIVNGVKTINTLESGNYTMDCRGIILHVKPGGTVNGKSPDFQIGATVEARGRPGTVADIAYNNGDFEYTVRLNNGKTLRGLLPSSIQHPRKKTNSTPGQLVHPVFKSTPSEAEDEKDQEREKALKQVQEICSDRSRADCRMAWEKFPNEPRTNIRIHNAVDWLFQNPPGKNLKKNNPQAASDPAPSAPVKPSTPKAAPSAPPLHLLGIQEVAPARRKKSKGTEQEDEKHENQATGIANTVDTAPPGKKRCPNPKCKDKSPETRGWQWRLFGKCDCKTCEDAGFVDAPAAPESSDDEGDHEQESRKTGQENQKDAKVADECAVCFEDNGNTHAMVPCGHKCVCANCAKLVMGKDGDKQCPLCRKPATMIIKVFRRRLSRDL